MGLHLGPSSKGGIRTYGRNKRQDDVQGDTRIFTIQKNAIKRVKITQFEKHDTFLKEKCLAI